MQGFNCVRFLLAQYRGSPIENSEKCKTHIYFFLKKINHRYTFFLGFYVQFWGLLFVYWGLETFENILREMGA